MSDAIAPPRRRRRLFIALVVLGSVLVALAIAELAVRIAWKRPWQLERDGIAGCAFHENFDFPEAAADPAHSPFPYERDDVFGYGLKPRSDVVVKFAESPRGEYRVAVNALGLREGEIAKKPQGALRVLALGDSMTFGIGVEREDAFPARLEQLLASALPSRAVQVLNAGVPGWGQQEELAFLRGARGDAIAPDVVVLELCVSNDVLDDLRYLDDGKKLVFDPRVRGDLERHWLLENPLASGSRLYELLMWRFGRHALRYQVMKDPSRLARVADLVRATRDAAAVRRAKLVVLVAPTLAQVEGGLSERVLGTRAINESFLSSARAIGVAAVDPLERLRALHETGKRAYFEHDMHWTADGHECVAGALAPLVLEAIGASR